MNPVVIDTNCLVTEDNHFNILKNTAFPKLNLVTLDEFMETRLVKGF